LPLQKAVNVELQRMQDEGSISPVARPTDWCSGMVIVRKKNGEVRICVDYTRLNRSVRRDHHVMPTVDTNLAKLSNAVIQQTWSSLRLLANSIIRKIKAAYNFHNYERSLLFQ